MEKSNNTSREQRILDAAAELFAHFGFDKTTVNDIAKKATVSKGAIYLHFATKEELFEALLFQEMERYGEKWMELVEADAKGGTLAGMYKHMLHAMNSNDFIGALLRQDPHVFGNYLRKPGNRFRGHKSTKHEFVKMMQEVGAIRSDIDPKVTAHIMNMLSYGLVSMEQIMPAEDIPPTNSIIEAIGEILDCALTPKEGGNSEAGKTVLRKAFEAGKQRLESAKTPS